MNSPPLPQPSARTCPHCGAALDESAPRCFNCGASVAASPKSGCLMIGAQLFLAFLSLIFGLGGACFALIGGLSLPSMMSNWGSGISEWGPVLGGGILGLALSWACVWGIIRLGKRHK